MRGNEKGADPVGSAPVVPGWLRVDQSVGDVTGMGHHERFGTFQNLAGRVELDEHHVVAAVLLLTGQHLEHVRGGVVVGLDLHTRLNVHALDAGQRGVGGAGDVDRLGVCVLDNRVHVVLPVCVLPVRKTLLLR